MIKTLFICLFGLTTGFASAASLIWNGASEGAWGTTTNWLDESTGSAPATVPSGNLTGGSQGSNSFTFNGNATITGGSMFASGNQTFIIKKGANVVLSSTLDAGTNRRFDGVFQIEQGSTLTVGNSYFFGNTQIYGTLIICAQFAPQDNSTLDFGLSGIMKLSESNTYNGIEGNGRTTAISATLSLGSGDNYAVFRRQLFDFNGHTNFDLNKWGGKWNISSGLIKDTAGNTLTAVTGDLVAGAGSLGNYKLGLDANNGIYIDYVAAVPEPTTATLGILGLSLLAMRRRRA